MLLSHDRSFAFKSVEFKTTINARDATAIITALTSSALKNLPLPPLLKSQTIISGDLWLRSYFIVLTRQKAVELSLNYLPPTTIRQRYALLILFGLQFSFNFNFTTLSFARYTYLFQQIES